MVTLRRLFTGMVLGLALGCGRDYQQMGDKMVADEFLKDGRQVPAIPFFEQGGKYFDIDEPTRIDQEIVLPMLKDLYKLSSTPQWVVPNEKSSKEAFALLVELPKDAAMVDAMAKIVEAADDRFDGMILQQWGHKWLSLDLIDQETAEFFKQSDPDFDKQR